MSFEIDGTAFIGVLLFAGVAFVLWRWSLTFAAPRLYFSKLQDFSRVGWRGRFAKLPRQLKLAAILFFILAFIDPHLFVEREETPEVVPLKETKIPTEGIAIYLVLDQSGSMSQEVMARSPEGSRTKVVKMDLLKRVTRDFVGGNPQLGLRGRPSDMIGLVAFARGAQVLSPLTLDHEAITDELNTLDFVRTRELDGTSIGYAIYKTVNLIAATRHYAEDLAGEGRPAYQIKSSVMILVTDGLQAPSPLDKGKHLRNIDLAEAAEHAKANEIKLYIINVEPRIASEEFAPHRRLMESVTELTGGKFYTVVGSRGLGEIYADIDRLEKSVLPIESQYVTPPKSMLPHLYNRISYYPYLVFLGMLCLFLGVVFDGTLFRRVP